MSHCPIDRTIRPQCYDGEVILPSRRGGGQYDLGYRGGPVHLVAARLPSV